MALTDTTLASPVPPASSRCPPAPSATSPSWESMLTGRVVGIALGAAGAAAAAVVVLFIYFKKNRRQPCSPCGSVPLGTGLCDFTPDQIRDFTNDFSEKNRLGGGAFGDVYYGVIPNGEEVAAKRLTVGGGQGDREFLAEIENLSRAHDKHVVSLVGYCSAGPERILVYKFVPNHTLAFHLRGGGLDWTARLKIAVGSAKGLQYLHDDCRPKIVHRDIKASNILLDSEFEAKISDFGLAKCISESRSHVTTVVKGTWGYIAPEYFSTGKLTEKSDIYSFGVVLLELITGRRPGGSTENSMGLVNWARPQLSRALEDEDFDSLVDSRLQNCYERNQMVRMVACAAACVCRVARDRPRMHKVVQVLEGNLPLSDLNDGTRCGLSIFCRCGGSLDNGTSQVLGKSKKIPLARQEYSSVGPSHQAPGDLELGSLDRDSQGFSGGS